MADIPQKRIKTVTRIEWVIGGDSEYAIARTLRDGIHFAQAEMEQLGIDTDYDDAFRWRAGDGASIVLYVDIDVDSEPDA